MALIEVENLVKDFKIIKKEKGIKGSINSLICPKKETVHAVDNIDFKVNKGEIVGYIGPNGAGKSTTVKMMTGILHPSSGEIRINGISPHKNRKKAVYDIGVVFGQRTQLYWDLRLGESFELLKRIYQIDDCTYNENLSIMDEVLEVGKLINTPVRQLSLGQRMRGDLAAAMLHSPSILFLDEPTIGLDIQGKESIRNFILDINRKKGTTVVLTTHDLDDVEELCNRLMIINHGKLVQDGPLGTIIDRIAPYRYLVLDLVCENQIPCHYCAQTTRQEGVRFWLKFNRTQISASQLISDLMNLYRIKDISLEEPKIEDIISEIYNRELCF